jgi:glycosyltransferase involved in cell wall biosynthesis
MRTAAWLATGSTPGPRRLLTAIALRTAHRIVAIAAYGHAALSALTGTDRVQFIPNGVDVRRYPPADGTNDPPRVLFAGYLTPRKGVLDLLHASALLQEAGTGHDLVLVGGTPTEGADAEEQVRQAAIPGARFVGPVPHEAMPEHYRAADVFCLPSWWEAMPMSVLEAMAAGLPVVASAVGEIPRLVQDGVTGVLVPPKHPAALAQALGSLLKDPLRRRAMGAAGRAAVAERFGLDRTLAALDELYRELAS